MRMGDETVQALEWAYGRLTLDQGLADALGIPLASVDDRVWPDVAPGDTKGPWVTIAAAVATDRAAVGPADRLSTVVTLDVKAVTAARTYTTLAPVARAIYDALHARTNDALAHGGWMLHAKRTGGIQYPERADGIDYRHLGHTFQVEIN
jgi:hypothetical protein